VIFLKIIAAVKNTDALMLACKSDVEQYAEAYHKIAENIDELLEYEKKNNVNGNVQDNAGRSINLFSR